ncbi:hypothetical protein [Virgisporangium aurantiacum]|uniref:Small secreted protein n=1 Tax=Virgisporangium aurantiacum TaxID=175570 RepID=A0A8J3Z0S4_9ACTN|nr:hypothetical protein [Virgisporangium aurantiacum]GIJ54362.1 hypothetical protein Vau01_018780 [Virgisporangium aurantiacum]
MRTLLLAMVAAIAVFMGGCAGDSGKGSSGTASSPTGSAATTASSAAADNTQQVCTQAKALVEEYNQKAAAVLTRAVTTGISDPEKADQILNEMVPLAKDYKTRFEALSATATNQRLKDALTTLAKKLDEVTSENASGALAVTEGVLTRTCGR